MSPVHVCVCVCARLCECIQNKNIVAGPESSDFSRTRERRESCCVIVHSLVGVASAHYSQPKQTLFTSPFYQAKMIRRVCVCLCVQVLMVNYSRFSPSPIFIQILSNPISISIFASRGSILCTYSPPHIEEVAIRLFMSVCVCSCGSPNNLTPVAIHTIQWQRIPKIDIHFWSARSCTPQRA